jgi:hypothetical protein
MGTQGIPMASPHKGHGLNNSMVLGTITTIIPTAYHRSTASIATRDQVMISRVLMAAA